jgi:hypothetical protein
MDDRHFYASVDDLKRDQGSALRALIGQTIQSSWIAWTQEYNVWLSSDPVVLRIGEQNLEIACSEFEKVYLFWNTINVLEAPDRGSFTDSFWKMNGLPELSRVIGQKIQQVFLLEAELRIMHEGYESSTWCLNGIEFELSEGYLQVYNALDENGVSNEPAIGPGVRRIRLD